MGNAAFGQRQNDVFGAVLDSILLHTRHNARLPRRLWPIVESQAECATRVWRNPDQDIWEARGKPQHYVSSKLICWVALDRASALAEIRGDPKLAATWRATADEIRADVLAHGISDKGVLRQHYETDALDASTLLAGSFNFLAHDDERLRNTVLTIAEELTENGFVLRYRTDETDDGLSGKEGTFLICSFWLVSAFAIIGELQRARDLKSSLLRLAFGGISLPSYHSRRVTKLRTRSVAKGGNADTCHGRQWVYRVALGGSSSSAGAPCAHPRSPSADRRPEGRAISQGLSSGFGESARSDAVVRSPGPPVCAPAKHLIWNRSG